MRLIALCEHRWLPNHGLAPLKILLLVLPILGYFLWQLDPMTIEEDGALEMGQTILLLLAGIMHVAQARRFKASSLAFAIHAGFALLAFSFAVRELDIDQFGTAPVWTILDRGLRIARTALWIGFMVFLIPRLKQLYASRAAIIALPVISMSLVAGLFLIAGGLFDRHVFSWLSLPTSRFLEEVLELDGYLVFLAAAFSTTTETLAPGMQSPMRAGQDN